MNDLLPCPFCGGDGELVEAKLETIMVVCGAALHEKPSDPVEYYREIIQGAHDKAKQALTPIKQTRSS